MVAASHFIWYRQSVEHRKTICPGCAKKPHLCLCAEITPVPTRTRLLILQHPREAKHPLNTARLVSLSLKNSSHCIGLSWPSLAHALGTPVENRRWGVLFLGTGGRGQTVPFQVLDRKRNVVSLRQIEGIVLLDGNWRQSKALWWRNPWLLKLNRMLLKPGSVSRFGNLRREPRRECLSTIEAAARSLGELGDEVAQKYLMDLFERFLARIEKTSIF